ncbi:unnamed protein product [Colias eurytheme]|nr:unnamed protein product [Colias eurytheme]
MASASGSGAAGSSDCEGEEQDDSSSSFSNDLAEVNNSLRQISIDNKTENKPYEDELSAFRQQWQRELEGTPSQQREAKQVQVEDVPQTDEEKAKDLFLRGVEMERGGKLYEAIQHYKRAIQILPDVESRLYDGSDMRMDTPVEESETEEICNNNEEDSDDDYGAVEGEDLHARLQRIVARKGYLCQPQFPTKGGHISWLPYEVVQLILRWVVSADLDAGSLERVSSVCRGLYVCAREPDVWRAMCVRTWGIECGTPRTHGFPNWREMFIDRPRLNLNGCYISKTTYLRHGENSFQDQFYRPWYLVDYYRYLRFFPEGLVLSWTTADEPAQCVGHLKYRTPKHSLGIVAGHYRLVGDKVVVVIKKTNSGKKVNQPAYSRFKSRRKEAPDVHEQIFHMEFELRSARSRRNAVLSWLHYAVRARAQWSTLELAAGKFPPLCFSRVRNYTAESDAPLCSRAC